MTEKRIQISVMKNTNDLKSQMLARMARRAPFGVWTATDFLNFGTRNAIDLTLSRMSAASTIRRIARGLYDLPQQNALTGKPTNPDPRQVIDALARRDPARMLIDGMTAANDLGLTTAVPARIIVHTDARLRPIKLGNQTITFKLTAPAKLYWAGRPAMRVVQALHWLRDTLDRDRDPILKRIAAILADSDHGQAIASDLQKGLRTLPDWMQKLLKPLLNAKSHSPSKRSIKVQRP
jgi:hypothetical protein